MGWERGERDSRWERESRLSGLLYADDLVLCDESEEDLRVIFGDVLLSFVGDEI